MANKKIADELKKEGRSAVKRGAKKGAKKAVKSVAKELGDDGKRRRSEPPRRSAAKKIIPYVMVVFALVLAICQITVHVAGLDDGAGVVGYYVQYVFGGLLGGGAVLCPAVFGYVGIKWCVYNVKWRGEATDPSSDSYPDYKKAKKRMILQFVMSMLVILMLSSLLSVFAGYDLLDGADVADMWEAGAEELLVGGGGVLGGLIGGALVAAFKQIISVILLIILLLVFGLLMFGLTPDYIIGKIQDGRQRRREERAALEAEALELEEKRRAEEEKNARRTSKAAATAAAAAATATQISEARAMSAEDIADAVGEEAELDARISPAESNTVGTAAALSGMKDGSAGKIAGGDFGDEIGEEESEFDPLDDYFKNMDTETGEIIEPKKASDSLSPIDLSEIGSDELRSDMAAVAPDEADGEEDDDEPPTPYVFPPIDMLEKNKTATDGNYTAELQENARQLLSTLQSFKINIKEINYSRGPTITRYELKPEAGVRVRSIANLVDDIALSLATSGVRIEAPIPGKAAVGIEVPNRNRATVYLRDLIDNSQFTDAKSRLTAALGMDVGGNPIYFDISKMPHMLIAGATGMGKSVCINCIIVSLLYKAKPEDLKLILIDPKKVEFNIYKDIPHLYAPIVSDPKKAAGALASAVAEMERRFELIEEVGVRDIASYNAATENDPYKEHMPHMVIIIDELADLMMTAPDEVETAICRLAQKARAAGIHIIIGTQRPSVDVITGLIKANIPSRIACTVASQVDSRTIIDIAGAEKLIGRGDMLFAPVGAAKPMRVQGAFVKDSEVENIATFIRDNNAKAKYNAEFINRIEEEAAKCGVKKGSSASSDMAVSGGDDGTDSKFQAAVKLAVEEGKISTSLMQRRLGVGYGRAAKIIDTMEEMGYVSKPDGNKPRRVLLSAEEYSRRVMDGTLGGGDEE